MNLPTLEMFINNFYRGKLTPDMLPDKRTKIISPVTFLDQLTYRSTVLDDSKDILVYFFASFNLSQVDQNTSDLKLLLELAENSLSYSGF